MTEERRSNTIIRNYQSDLLQQSIQLISTFSVELGLNNPYSLLYINANCWNLDEIEEFITLENTLEELFCNNKSLCVEESISNCLKLRCGHSICKKCFASKLKLSLESLESCFSLNCKVCELKINKDLFSCNYKSEDFVLNYQELLIATSPCPRKIIFFQALKKSPLMIDVYQKCPECGFSLHLPLNCQENERNSQLSALSLLKCDYHHNIQATRFNLTDKTLLCESCRGQSGDSYLSLSSSNFSKHLKAKILYTYLADQASSTINYPDLNALSLPNLIKLYRNIGRDSINSPVCLINSKCAYCLKCFSSSNKPYIYSLVLKCEACSLLNSGPMIALSDSTIISNPSPLPFISILNSIPCCSRCGRVFNLKDRFPREFSCGHLICQSCLKSKHQSIGNESCYICQGPQAIKSLASNSFLIHCIRRTLINCSRHKGHAATHIEEVSLKSFCSKCLMFSQGNKLDLSMPNLRLFNFLYETFVNRQQADGISKEVFEGLSFQEMIDEIRGLADPGNRDSLNSSIPKGRSLDECVSDCEDNCFLIRFLTVMPSAEKNPNYALVTKAWTVTVDQVEAFSFTVDRPIVLTGMIFGQRHSIGQAFIGKIQFIKGNTLAMDGENLVDSIVEIDNRGLSQKVMFKPVPMLAREFYSLVVSVNGYDVSLIRGNPFDIKEEQLGSDGTRFEFFEPADPGDYKINGQHDISGPILGLIYK